VWRSTKAHTNIASVGPTGYISRIGAERSCDLDSLEAAICDDGVGKCQNGRKKAEHHHSKNWRRGLSHLSSLILARISILAIKSRRYARERFAGDCFFYNPSHQIALDQDYPVGSLHVSFQKFHTLKTSDLHTYAPGNIANFWSGMENHCQYWRQTLLVNRDFEPWPLTPIWGSGA
jgi:hypothetical protein